jgi:hypothetical protein
MRRFIALVLVGAVAVAACGSSAGPASSAAKGNPSAGARGTVLSGGDCPSVIVSEGGSPRYCGPAQATVTFEGTTYNLSGGQCKIGWLTAGAFTLEVGVSSGASAPQYLTLQAGSVSAGSDWSKVQVAGDLAGTMFSSSLGHAVLTIAGDHKSGTISGSVNTIALSEFPMSGTFTC